jgi:hypothetical protein
VTDVIAWWWLVLRVTTRDLWDTLPGPWPVKITLIVLTQAIPGQLDDIALLALLAWLRRRKAASAHKG